MGLSVGALLLSLILTFVIRKRLRASKSRLDTTSSSPRSFPKSTHSDTSLVEEIGNNSLYNAYPELHDTGRVEILTSAIPPGPRNSVSELPQSSNSVLSDSDRAARAPKNEVGHTQATVVRGQKIRSSNTDDRSSSSNQRNQHKVNKTHRRPALSHIKSLPSVPRRKESSLIYQHFITPTQPTVDGLGISPTAPNAHYELPVSPFSNREPSQTGSASSTYANIIDYDCYRHGTPTDEERETNSRILS